MAPLPVAGRSVLAGGGGTGWSDARSVPECDTGGARVDGLPRAAGCGGGRLLVRSQRVGASIIDENDLVRWDETVQSKRQSPHELEECLLAPVDGHDD